MVWSTITINLFKIQKSHPIPDDLICSLRVLPHQQNTGGFFVAVLKKVAALPWESTKTVENTTPVAEDKDADEAEAVKEAPRSPTRKKRRMQGFKEDPYFFFEKDEESWPSIK